MTKKKNETSVKKEFKKAKTKKKTPAAKKQPYIPGGGLCRVPGQWKPNPNWKEQW